MTRIKKWIAGKPNPLSKAAWGSLVYLDTKLETPPQDSRTLLSVTVNDKCNLECSHCVEEKYERGPENYEVLKKRVEELPERSLVWFSISGKEPTISPEKTVEMAGIGRRKAEKVIIMTNGIEFTKDLQEKLARTVDYVDVSVDGIDAYKNPDKRVWENIGEASKNRFGKIAVLTTIIGGEERNYKNVGDLIDRISGDFEGRVAHSIGFYLGWPGDERVLSENQIIQAISQIAKKDFKTTVQIPPMYSRHIRKIFREFGLKLENVRYDSATGIPSYDLNGHRLVVASHLQSPLIGLRAEIDGKVYFGCSHLMINGGASSFAIGDLEKDSFEEIIQGVKRKSSKVIKKVSLIARRCLDSGDWEYCRGGDRLGGYIHIREPIDPYCQKGECCHSSDR